MSMKCLWSLKGSKRFSGLAVLVVTAALLVSGCVRMTPEYIKGSGYERAVLLYQSGQLSEARLAAAGVPTDSPDARSAKVLIGTIDATSKRLAAKHADLASEYERAGMYRAALHEYREARAFAPDDKRINDLIKKMEDAIAAHRAPDMAQLLKAENKASARKSSAAPKQNKPAGTVGKLRASQEADELAGLHYTRGRLYLDQGDYPAAIREFEAVLVVQPGYMDTIVLLGDARSRMSDVVDRHLKQGISYFQKEEMALAISEWEAALTLDPANQRAADYKARAELIIERLEKIRERQGAGR